MNNSNIFHKLVIAILFLPLFCHSQQKTDAQELINRINKTTQFTSSAMEHSFRFSSANHGYEKEEIKKMKIRSITICLNNKWAYTGNDKGCIKLGFDQFGNIIQSTLLDSAKKIKEILNYTYVYDAKKNILETKITTQPNTYSMSIVYKYDNLDRLVSRQSYKRNTEVSAKPPITPVRNEEVNNMMPQPDDAIFTEKFEYNASNQVIKYELLHGNTTKTISFVHDSLSRITAAKHLFLKKIYYKITPYEGNVYWADSTITNPIDYEYTYDPTSGNLIQIKSVVNGSASVTGYTYTKTGMFSEIKQTHNDPSQITLKKNYYDEQDRIIKTENRSGANMTLTNSIVYSYTDKGAAGRVQKAMVFTTLGYSETYTTFDSMNRLIEEKGSYTGNATGDIRIFHNSFSKRISFEYFN